MSSYKNSESINADEDLPCRGFGKLIFISDPKAQEQVLLDCQLQL